jgi:hypothetical protein
MRDLQFAVHPSTDPTPRRGGRAAWPLSRNAFMLSILVHAAIAYVALRIAFDVDAPSPTSPSAEFLWLGDRSLPPPVVEVPQPPPAIEAPTTVEPREAPPEPAPVRREVPQPEVVVTPPAPVVPETEIGVPAPTVPSIDFEAERRRAASEVIEQRAGRGEYLTFSIDDVAPPRAEPEPKPERSIFDGGGGRSAPSIGQVGQQRTRVGRKLVEVCNALTGGFGFFGLFSACAKPDDEPSGLFPEVRPAYLDLQPECAESQPENPELAAAAPFSTVKCRLVQQVEVERWAYPGKPPAPP